LNFLAHLLLSSYDDEEMLGNLLGDFVRKGGEEHYGEAIQRGILLHRRIDGFTDGHPVFRRSRRRVREPLRRYGGIAVDLFYDHILAATFNDYHDTSLEQFARRAYRLLQRYEPILPMRLQRIMPAMIGQDWLVSYREIGGIERALLGISGRLSRPNELAATVEDLHLFYDEFSADFREFFPAVTAFAARERMRLETERMR
jgi:acyl carrier protein phosphodiesterase